VVGKNYPQAAEPDASITVHEDDIKYLTEENKRKKINELRRAMEKAAKDLDFIEAARLRDMIKKFNA
jgi:excinuclease ABC subunit B